MNIWVLSHQYDYGDLCDKYKWDEEGRILGVYYTKEEALKSLIEYQKIKGFSSHLDGFCIEKCKLDKNLGWEGGFETTYYSEVKNNNNLFQENHSNLLQLSILQSLLLLNLIFRH
mgnify:CR=1 FL=1